MLSKLREPVSGLTHLGATIVALVAVVILLFVGRGGATKLISLAIYGLSLILMFAASAAYHLVNAAPHVVSALRKLDHSAIYCLIAGTYTPICLHFCQGFWQWGFTGVIWSLAVAGITVKLFVIKAPRWLTAGIYLVMGWLALIVVPEIAKTMPPPALAWILAGGIVFTLGSIVYITKKPDFFPEVFGFHEVWHIFVILGSACHFIAIAVFVAPYPTL